MKNKHMFNRACHHEGAVLTAEEPMKNTKLVLFARDFQLKNAFQNSPFMETILKKLIFYFKLKVLELCVCHRATTGPTV